MQPVQRENEEVVGRNSPSPENQHIREIRGKRIEPEKTGTLEYIARLQYICVDCKTVYHINTESSSDGTPLIPDGRIGKALCNGHVIMFCPWCRPDSKPWKDGRGI